MAAWQRSILSCCAAFGLAGPAAAQGLITLPPSAAIECMTPPEAQRGTPVYDADLLRRKEGGSVRVELSFASATSAPAVRFIGPLQFSGLTEAVEAHVSKLRVPCMPAGADAVRILQTYDFVPNDGRKVMASTPVDAKDAEWQEAVQCLTRIVGGDIPDYPRRSRMAGDEGNFLVRVVFDSATAPPKASFLGGPNLERLRLSVLSFVDGYRLPCLGSEPVTFDQTYMFRLDGGARTLFKDMTLQQFVGAADKLPSPAYFDTTKMGCPFDLRVTYMQPYKANHVGELDTTHPERRTLRDWLANTALRLDKPYRVLGDEFTVSVPCIIIDL
jgi:hypothetical protein